MARITLAEAQAWGEPTKLPLPSLDISLVAQVEEQVIARLSSAYTTITWIDAVTTPRLVRSVIAMFYMSWLYDRAYSEDNELNAWAARLAQMANDLLTEIIEGTIDIPDVPGSGDSLSGPVFYPTDASTAGTASADDWSQGPESFNMGKVW